MFIDDTEEEVVAAESTDEVADAGTESEESEA